MITKATSAAWHVSPSFGAYCIRDKDENVICVAVESIAEPEKTRLHAHLLASTPVMLQALTAVMPLMRALTDGLPAGSATREIAVEIESEVVNAMLSARPPTS